jgi:hypothetical protein
MAGFGLLLTLLEKQVKMRKELDTPYGLAGAKPEPGVAEIV